MWLYVSSFARKKDKAVICSPYDTAHTPAESHDGICSSFIRLIRQIPDRSFGNTDCAIEEPLRKPDAKRSRQVLGSTKEEHADTVPNKRDEQYAAPTMPVRHASPEHGSKELRKEEGGSEDTSPETHFRFAAHVEIFNHEEEERTCYSCCAEFRKDGDAEDDEGECRYRCGVGVGFDLWNQRRNVRLAVIAASSSAVPQLIEELFAKSTVIATTLLLMHACRLDASEGYAQIREERGPIRVLSVCH